MREIMKKFVTPLAMFVLMAICALAAYSHYQVSISMTDGFRFEPARTQTFPTSPA
jgi:hypothetical protein